MNVRERNENATHALYEAERRRDITAWEALWREDALQTFSFTNRIEPVVGRSELVRLTKAKFAERPPYEIDAEVEAMADPQRVLARLRLHGGEIARSAHVWCVLHFDDNGLIARLEELADNAPRSE